MSEGYEYHAVIDDEYTRENPFALLRREVMPDGGYGRDEAMSPAMDWKYTTWYRSWQRGDTRFDFIKLDEAEAKGIEEKFLAERAAREAQQ